MSYQSLVEQYKGGKPMRQILSENPDVKRTTMYYHIKKTPEIGESIPQAREIPREIPRESIPRPNQIERTDAFLNNFKSKKTGKLGWQKENEIMDLFGDVMPSNSKKTSFDPMSLLQDDEPKTSTKSNIPMTKSWWSKEPRTKKEMAKEEAEQKETDRLALVQKCRLYIHHFPDLGQLHLVPKKRDGEADVDKFIKDLYTKKEGDLEKIIHLFKFSCRNRIGNNSTITIAENVLKTGTKILEHTLCMTGMKVNGLCDKIMDDEDVSRCLKEILIDSSINTLSYGPKTDLGLKVGMAIVQLDSQNRIEEKMLKQKQDVNSQKSEIVRNLESKKSDDLIEKYEDL